MIFRVPLMPQLFLFRNAGHNKWSKIKKHKGENDASKMKQIGRISMQIISAIKAMGGETDPSLNMYLSAALSLAKSAQMPKTTIEQAIKKATNKNKDQSGELYSIIYEGLGPCGVSVMVETLTSNRNKTFSETRHIFSKYGSMGPVSYLFKRHGFLIIDAVEKDKDAIVEDAIETDLVEDVDDTDSEKILLKCSVSQLLRLQSIMVLKGYKILESDIRYESQDKIKITKEAEFDAFLNEMENQEEVIRVHHNAE
jgi:YebC/PmpR family DNA-binding regulatory protein